MGLQLSKSVGRGGGNLYGDVQAIQSLLNRATSAGLVVDGKCGPLTTGAIESFQRSFLKRPDSRVDVGGTTWGNLSETRASPQTGSGNTAKPLAKDKRNRAIVTAVDADPVLRGAGITVISAAGKETDVRGGPRRNWIYISAVPAKTTQPSPRQRLPSFWDRWGGAVLSCGSATATGVVIYLTGGTASLVVGAFAVNSAALCGMSLGKAIEYDAWQAFEQQGGGVYKSWLTIETAMSLADLFSGVKGAVGALKAWEKAGKLQKLSRKVANKKLTRKQLLKAIQEVDPSFKPNLAAKGAGYYSKSKLVIAGQRVITANRFKSLSNQQARVLLDAVGNAFTLAGAPENWTSTKDTYEVWFVQYGDESK